MNQEHHSNNQQCPSSPTLMAFLDAQLEGDERAAVRSHLDTCARCRQMAEEMATASKAMAIHMSCLDDGSMSAYVDHQAGRVRGALSEGELQRIRYHLDRCERCREEVDVLAQACETRVGTLDRLRSILGGGGSAGRPGARPAFRWAAATAIVVVAGVLAFLGLRGREPGRVPPGGREVVEAPIPSIREPGLGVGEEAPSEAQPPGAEPRIDTAGPQERPSRQPQFPAETALMDEMAGAEGEVAEALAALDRARKSGDAGAEARATFEVAGIYHMDRDYGSAARHYRGSIAAAERADEVELRIDSMVLLGAALAEMGDAQEARKHFDLALGLAREAGYERGETNARVQLRVLEGESGAGER